MKTFLVLIVLLTGYPLATAAQEASGNKVLTAAGGDMIANSVKAYNEKDIEAYLACFSPDVEVYNAAGVLMCQGKDKLRESFDALFRNQPNTRRKILERISSGNRIVERELVAGIKGTPEASVTSVYELENGLIRTFYFVAEF